MLIINLLFTIILYTVGLYSQVWVNAVIPNLNEINVLREAFISVDFNQNINSATLNENTVKVYSNTKGYFLVTGLTYDLLFNRLEIDPLENFLSGESITVILTTGIQNDSGTNMSSPYSWTFIVQTINGTGEFGAAQTIRVGTRPNWVTTLDFVPDGMIDLAVANSNSNNISLIANDGEGGFVLYQTVNTGTTPESITAGDFNNDGDVDIATANAGSNNVSILENDGLGNFSPLHTIAVGTSPHTINSGDVNGDGYIDLVTSNFGSGNMSVLLNDGAGNFTSSNTSNIGSGPELGLLDDIDNDGDFDLSVPNYNSNNFSIMINDGAGMFTPSFPLTVGTTPHLGASGDLNNDGYIDFIVPNSKSNNVSVLLNDGAGNYPQFTTFNLTGSPWFGVSGDIDADGDIDLVINVYNLGRVSIQFNDGSGNFSEHSSVTVESNPHTTVMGDFNDDGALDLAVANDGSNSVMILYSVTVSVDDNLQSLPEEFKLSQNYPNPFNPTTSIQYAVSSSQFVSLMVYDVLGNEIVTLVDEEKSAGSYVVEFSAKGGSASGGDASSLPSGVYFYRLQAGNFVEYKKMVLIK